jgi:2-polyprenyl-6-methoxyphenol hydroxylase-like FAD-dependent oxidoreductase
MASTVIGKRAVVIGAGMGGLSAAAALADGFGQVIVLDATLSRAEPGIVRGRRKHGTCMRCCSAASARSASFLGFRAGAYASRRRAAPVGLDVRVERPGYDPFPQRDLGWLSYALSRPAIERIVRARVESLTNTTLRQRCRVQKILATADGALVTGVRFEGGDGRNETIAADLIVDASGHGALTLALLQSIGLPLPEETTIGIDCAMPHASLPSRMTPRAIGKA